VLQLCAFGQQPQIGVRSFSNAEAAATVSYWTLDRVNTARPADNVKVDQLTANSPASPIEPAVTYPSQLPNGQIGTAGQIGALNPIQFGPIPLAFEDQYPYPFTRFDVYRHLYASNAIPPVFPYRAIGKLFFTDQTGANFICSASVIRPHLVLTARHCIFNYVDPQGGQFFTTVVFYPGWFCAAAPCPQPGGANGFLHNGWPARMLATWVSNAAGAQFDIGFIQTFDDQGGGCGGSSGRPIESYTGVLGFQTGGDVRTFHYNMFGYPAAPPFTGTLMVEAQGSPGADNPFGTTNTFSNGNDMTGGSSGGPWIISFFPDQSGNANIVFGLNSFGFVTRPLETVSPKFLSTNFTPLLTGAIGLPCP
jgi:V8-like Glu-specific endopeptidase